MADAESKLDVAQAELQRAAQALLNAPQSTRADHQLLLEIAQNAVENAKKARDFRMKRIDDASAASSQNVDNSLLQRLAETLQPILRNQLEETLQPILRNQAVLVEAFLDRYSIALCLCRITLFRQRTVNGSAKPNNSTIQKVVSSCSNSFLTISHISGPDGCTGIRFSQPSLNTSFQSRATSSLRTSWISRSTAAGTPSCFCATWKLHSKMETGL